LIYVKLYFIQFNFIFFLLYINLPLISLMSDTKNIILTGGALDTVSKGRKRTSRKNQNGGGSTQGAIVQLQSTTSSSTAEVPTEGVNPSKLAEIAAPVLCGGASHSKLKVVLNAPKKKTQKVVLSVAKTLPALKPTTFMTSKNKTRKSSKRIQFSLKNLRKKLGVAKTIKKHSEEKSLEEIKKILSDAKLIKKDSKAPESMIRQIYNDFMTLKHKAL
jgi:hypothetical protein